VFEEHEAGLLHLGAVVLAYVHAIAASPDVLLWRPAFLEGDEVGVEDEGDHGRGECDCEVENIGWGWRRWDIDW